MPTQSEQQLEAPLVAQLVDLGHAHAVVTDEASRLADLKARVTTFSKGSAA